MIRERVSILRFIYTLMLYNSKMKKMYITIIEKLENFIQYIQHTHVCDSQRYLLALCFPRTAYNFIKLINK